jgi:hypothetical protein
MTWRKPKNESEALGPLIHRLLKAYQLDGKMKELDVLNAWEDLMGKAVALRTSKIYIRDKILYLSIDSSVMRDELAQGKQIIIEKINQLAGENYIKDVWFS